MSKINHGIFQILQVLIKAGSRLDDKDNVTGSTPLMAAVQTQHTEAVRLLVAAGMYACLSAVYLLMYIYFPVVFAPTLTFKGVSPSSEPNLFHNYCTA